MTIEIKQIIDKEFNVNYKVYQNFCINLYKKNYLYEDLLNESYITLVEMPIHKLEKHINECTLEGLIKGIIFYKFKKRFRPNSNLEDRKTVNIDEINISEQPKIEYDFTKTLTILKKEHPKHFEMINELMQGARFEQGARSQSIYRAKLKLKEIHGKINN